MPQILNRELLADNACFGCGHDNPTGLGIELFRDPSDETRLRGRFTPDERVAGFPGIAHGGAVYSALDCLSSWVALLLGPNGNAIWLLRSAATKYHNPAPIGQPLALHGWITAQDGPWDPVVVRTEARRKDGALCVSAEFKSVPLSVDKLKKVTGLDALPENWCAFFAAKDGRLS